MLILHVFRDIRPHKSPCEGIAIRPTLLEGSWTFTSFLVRKGTNIHAKAIVMESTYKWYPDLSEFRDKQDLILRSLNKDNETRWWQHLRNATTVRH
ncbi:MAG: hypothetical protein GF334_08745 [Candidatus Altiarchaeales archaeon]|nr:hypothetical protein [Candidatus Altiarchaeales archaeon]